MELELLNSIIKKILSKEKIHNDFLLDFPNHDIFISEAIKQNNCNFLKKAKEKNYIFTTKDLFLALDFDSFNCFSLISQDIDFNEEIIKEICKRKDASYYIYLLMREEKIDPYSDTYEEIFYQNNLFELSFSLLDHSKEKLLKRFLKEKKELFLSYMAKRENDIYDENFINFLKYLLKKNKRTLLNEVLKIWKEEDVETLETALDNTLKYINENNFFMLKDLIDYLIPVSKDKFLLFLFEIILSIYLNTVERITDKFSKKIFTREDTSDFGGIVGEFSVLSDYQIKSYPKILLKVFKELESLNLISFDEKILEEINFYSIKPLIKYSIKKGFKIDVARNIIMKNFSILNYQIMANKNYVERKINLSIYEIISDKEITLDSIIWIYNFFPQLEILKSGYIIDMAVLERKDIEIILFLNEKMKISKELLYLSFLRNDEYSNKILDLYKKEQILELNNLKKIYESNNIEKNYFPIVHKRYYDYSIEFKFKEVINLNEEEIKNNKNKEKEGFYLINALLMRNLSLVETIIRKRVYERFDFRITSYISFIVSN